MSSNNRLTGWLGLWALIACLFPGAAYSQVLELKRVMLSAGGVGYFEHEATVTGDAVLELSVRLDQVDDVLKSIVVYDDTGRAGSIRLPGRQPLQAAFRDLPFGPDALASSVTLLQSLIGAEVQVSGQRRLNGLLVSVTAERIQLGSSDQAITRHRVSVMTEQGLQSFLLEEADAVRFSDAMLERQVNSALAAVSAHRARDRRTLQVVSHGQSTRIVRVGYVVAAPLWKASYRLSLARDTARTARLQGWAVLENMSGQDWQEVELTLVSGNPVTFRQALYTAYYVNRPEVPVEVLGRILPKSDEGAIALDERNKQARRQGFRAAQRLRRGALGSSSSAESTDEDRLQPAGVASPAPSLAQESVAMAPPPRQAAIVAAASVEAATSVTFRIPKPVSVASGHSLLAPVVDTEIPAERVSLYQPATHQRHPLAAVRLMNASSTGLPPGVLTLYETGTGGASFVGDAKLSPLPSGEARLLSYALDQKASIDREMRDERTIAKGRIANGVLEVEYAAERLTTYRLKAPAKEKRRVVLEHPRLAGWSLERPSPEQTELTDSSYRITRELAAGEHAKLEVVLSRPTFQKIALLDLKTPQFTAYASNDQLDPKLRAAFKRMRELRSRLDAHERRQQQLAQERKRIHEEQKRIRNNLARVPRDSDLHKRYIKKLNAQEDALESLLGQSEELRGSIADARKALNDYIVGLEL